MDAAYIAEGAAVFSWTHVPFPDDYKESLETMDSQYAVAVLGFDQSTRYSTYFGMLYDCTSEERNAALDLLRSSDVEIAKRDLALLALTKDAADKVSGAAD